MDSSIKKSVFIIYTKRILCSLLLIIAIGYAIPEKYNLPVANMNGKSFNHQSFWYYPWGASICHKGVDIFAPKGNEVYAATSGMIINVGNHPRGGNMILIIGPKWRIHHYLHLDTIIAQQFHFVSRGTTIGKVGNSGNASNKPSHLHYSITTIIPYLWQADNSIQGYKKIWFIDPTPYLLNKQNN